MANFVEGHQTSPINITTQRKKQPSKNYKSTSNYHHYFLIIIHCFHFKFTERKYCRIK